MCPTLPNMVFWFCEPSDVRSVSHLDSHFKRSRSSPKQKKWFFPFLFFLFALCSLPASHGQGIVNIDSLIREMEQSYSSTQIIDTLNEWAFIKREDEDLSEKYANKALKLSGKNGYEKGEGDACVRLG
ncbi:MAG: hypothetical protein J5I98_30775, partial [Phaeodactylibacter sp.]|nr:hypothetical protein [Phaeodactylibacter sp.]